MKKIMPVVISLITLTLLLIYSAPTLASSYDPTVANDELSLYAEQGMPIQMLSDENHNIYTVTITDKEILAKIQEEENRTNQGELVERTLTYVLPKSEALITESNSETDEPTSQLWNDWTLGNWKYISNQWYYTDKGIPFRIEGAADYDYEVETVTKYSISGEGSGKVKGIVELKLGADFESASTKTWRIKVKIPEGYYREFEVWEYLNKYEFNVLKDGKTYGTDGVVYEPNGGQKLKNDLYKK